jgi:hypothetical protein
MTTWPEWIATTLPPRITLRSIARTMGDSHNSVTRWLAREQPPAEFVIRLAREFRADPIEGLIAAGYLHAAEASAVGIVLALHTATDLQLANETYARVLRGAAGPELTDGEIAARGLAAGQPSAGGGGAERIILDGPDSSPAGGGGGIPGGSRG